MISIPAIHVASGVKGEIQDKIAEPNGSIRYYFEDHATPSRAGWYFQGQVVADI